MLVLLFQCLSDKNLLAAEYIFNAKIFYSLS